MNFYRKSDIPAELRQYFEPAEIGLESTPDAYVAELVAVFREVRRGWRGRPRAMRSLQRALTITTFGPLTSMPPRTARA